jgi:hypothetical protein
METCEPRIYSPLRYSFTLYDSCSPRRAVIRAATLSVNKQERHTYTRGKAPFDERDMHCKPSSEYYPANRGEVHHLHQRTKEFRQASSSTGAHQIRDGVAFPFADHGLEGLGRQRTRGGQLYSATCNSGAPTGVCSATQSGARMFSSIATDSVQLWT